MSPILLYDGACGLCSRTVQQVLRHDRRGELRFAPLDGRFAAALRAQYPELDYTDSVVWYEPPAEDGARPRLLLRSAAVLAVARYLGGPWTLALIARIVPGSLRDAVYDLMARHRHRLFGGRDQCMVSRPEVRARLLD